MKTKGLDRRMRPDIALALAQGLQATIKRTACAYCGGSGQQQSDGCCVASTVCPNCGGEMYEPLKRSEIEAAVDKIIEALA
jgi:NADH pyrophosphatase NudC (nudix superfamily)